MTGRSRWRRRECLSAKCRSALGWCGVSNAALPSSTHAPAARKRSSRRQVSPRDRVACSATAKRRDNHACGRVLPSQMHASAQPHAPSRCAHGAPLHITAPGNMKRRRIMPPPAPLHRTPPEDGSSQRCKPPEVRPRRLRPLSVRDQHQSQSPPARTLKKSSTS